MRSDYESMSEAEAMSELARLMWERYFKPRASEELLNHSLDGYKSQVVTNNNDGTLTVMRPFDNTYMTLKCPPALAQSAQPGDQVLVIYLGDASNSFILCGTDMSGFGEGGSGELLRPVSFDFSTIADGYFTETVEDDEGRQVSTIYDVTFDANGRIDSVTNRSDNWETTVEWGEYEMLPAKEVGYDNTGTSLSADTVQGAISELANGGGGGSGAAESIIATVEPTATASKNYIAGEYLILSGVLYRATTAITSGSTITVGTNVTAAVIGDDLSAHVLDQNNPHGVTAAQTGAYVKPAGGIPAADLASGVIPAASNVAPPMDGEGAVGTWASYARGNHVHPTDTSRQAKITASGILKGDGNGGVSAAVSGTDYQAPLTAGTDYATPGMIPTVPSASTANPAMDGTAAPGSTGQWADGGHVHPTDTSRMPKNGMGKNLLHNWYFVGGGTGKGVFPVNQRGGTTYTGNGYHIDGWINYNNPTLTLGADGVAISGSSLAAYANMMRQSIDNPENYRGVTLTLSALMENATAGIYVAINDGTAHTSSDTVAGTNLLKVTWTVGSSATALSVNFHNRTAGASPSFRLIAAKLEIGTEQTLAHQENGVWVLNDIPNYEEELVKCQTSTADSSDTYANKTLATEQQIAQIQVGNTANRNYSVDSYFCWNGLLYRVTAPISNGAPLTIDTNCVKTTVTDPLADALIAKSIGSWSSTTGQAITFPRGSAHLLIFVSTSSTKGAMLLLNCSGTSGFIAYQAIYKGSNISFATSTETITATLATTGDTVFVTDLPLKGGENNQYASMSV